MDIHCGGCFLNSALMAGGLMLGALVCSQTSYAQQRTLQDAPVDEIEREQHKAAAMVEETLLADTPPMAPWKGYAPLPVGQSRTEAGLIYQVQKVAASLKRQSDTSPANAGRALGHPLPPDAEGRRNGITGKLGAGTYTWAVWKLSPQSPGYVGELVVDQADACISFEALKTPLLAQQFQMYVPTFGDDRRITFHKAVNPSLGLYVAVTVDRLDAPTCARIVSFEMERIGT